MIELTELTFDRIKDSTHPEFGWRDISSEQYRTYVFPDGSQATIRMPVALSLGSIGGAPEHGGGSHRIVDACGVSHYIPRGWIKLSWVATPFYEF